MTSETVVLAVGVSAGMMARLRHVHLDAGEYDLVEVGSEAEALAVLRRVCPKVVMVNTGLAKGGSLSLADYIAYRYPETRVIFEMGPAPNFTDGSLFAHAANAHALVTPGMQAEDVGAVVAHHATCGMSA